MTYDVYRIIFFACAGAAAFCLILAIVLFFVLDIWGVIGNLSGSTAKKAIENIRKQNVAETGNLSGMHSGANKKKKSDPTSVIRNQTMVMGSMMETSKLNTGNLENEAKQSFSTTVLNGTSGGTTLLQPEEDGATSILTADMVSGADGQFGGNAYEMDENPYMDAASVFTIEYEISFIHTDEVIS